MSSYYYTSNTSLIGSDPCALYQAGSGTSCNDPTATNFGAQTACTYSNSTSTSANDLLNALNGTNVSGSGSLSATPATGAAPLSVTFTSSPVSSGTYTIDPGDGGGAVTLTSSGCASSNCIYTGTYTYATAGTYTATLSDQNGNSVGTASIAVTNPGGPGTAAGSGLGQIIGNIGNFLLGSSSTGQTASNLPGILGNILLDQNGATIFASTVANNSAIGGFYGSNTVGGQPRGIAAQLCVGRPWASNFLANIIPPSFFDGLCQLSGFQVGQLQPQNPPQVTLTQQPKAPPKQAATSSAPTVAPQAVIWAEPAAVPLGARTSIFWNSQGVTECTESSPNGSFTEESLSGAAATVPITESTTFTISCTDPSGNPITGYVIVSISN
jgi:hypothetical protein